MGQWELVCPEPVGTVVVYAKGVPGWRVDATPGTPPILLRAAEWYVWADGVIVEGPYTMDSPPGLASKLVGPCLLHLYGGSTDTFDMCSEATWFQFP